jgi:PII-like signaling protein
MSRGKYAKITGEKNGNSRLTPELVREIREKHANGATVTSLIQSYGVSQCAMAELLAFRSWRHVV